MNDVEITQQTVEGRCLCGQSRYRVVGECTGMVHCHCQRCRKSHGASLASWTHFRRASFVWLDRGEVSHYHSSPSVRRSFCTTCGATVPDPDTSADEFGFPAGNVLQMSRPEPIYHFFVGSKARWTFVADDEEQFQIVPDHFRDPKMENLDRPNPSVVLSGSCLCGEVTFEAGTPAFMMNCHCTRCRLSRAAPHATNLFVARKSLRWLTGKDQVRNYRLPEAERFGVGFCGHCGGLVPRTQSDSDLTNIPSGCLDSDPGVRPAGHIFTGSKAAWFDITDDLPQWRSRYRTGEPT